VTAPTAQPALALEIDLEIFGHRDAHQLLL
jgi:hypothetical protein